MLGNSVQTWHGQKVSRGNILSTKKVDGKGTRVRRTDSRKSNDLIFLESHSKAHAHALGQHSHTPESAEDESNRESCSNLAAGSASLPRVRSSTLSFNARYEFSKKSTLVERGSTASSLSAASAPFSKHHTRKHKTAEARKYRLATNSAMTIASARALSNGLLSYVSNV
jgi:hypothetical protein